MNHLGEYDVIVIGAGHAGIEAAHAAATLGARTAVFTMSLDAIGNMPCNPSIGGTAKGTLVRELDALGGVMGLAADATYLQSRMLNKGKGPAVHALRVQTDRKRYHEYMKHALELTPGLAIHQAEVVGLEVENGRVKGIVTQLNGEYTAKCVVLATGTNLGGKIFVGDAWYASGPDGMHAANALTESLKAAGLDVMGDPAMDYTETHQVIVSVGYGVGAEVAKRLEENNIIVNYQATPDEEGFTASGALRMGVSEMTRFGFEAKDFDRLAGLMADCILRGEAVKEDIQKLRAAHTEMKYCFTDQEVEDAMEVLAEKIGL